MNSEESQGERALRVGFSERASGLKFGFGISICMMNRSSNASYIGHTLDTGRGARRNTVNGTYSTQVLLKARGDWKLRVTSFISVTAHTQT